VRSRASSRAASARGLEVIDDYLGHRAWHESPAGLNYLRSFRDLLMSLFEVVGLLPGSHFVLEDLVRGGL
jgi:hypothetical protein